MNKIKDEKGQYNINKVAAKYQNLQLEKLINMSVLQVKKILSCNQNRMIERAKFTYSPLGKAFEKQIKTNEDKEGKQIKALEEHRKQIVKFNAFTEKHTI